MSAPVSWKLMLQCIHRQAAGAVTSALRLGFSSTPLNHANSPHQTHFYLRHGGIHYVEPCGVIAWRHLDDEHNNPTQMNSGTCSLRRSYGLTHWSPKRSKDTPLRSQSRCKVVRAQISMATRFSDSLPDIDIGNVKCTFAGQIARISRHTSP